MTNYTNYCFIYNLFSGKRIGVFLSSFCPTSNLVRLTMSIVHPEDCFDIESGINHAISKLDDQSSNMFLDVDANLFKESDNKISQKNILFLKSSVFLILNKMICDKDHLEEKMREIFGTDNIVKSSENLNKIPKRMITCIRYSINGTGHFA